MYIIGIDIGTTNSKVVLYSAEEFKQEKLFRFETGKKANNGETDFDLDQIWLNLKRGIKEVSNEIKEKNKIVGISIASVGESGVLLDSHNRRIGPAIAWFDPRGREYIKKLEKKNALNKIYRITGIPPHSNYSLPKILWIRNKYPESNKPDVTWLCLANYFAFLLTGKKTTEVTLASRTLAFDIEKNDWSEEILESVHLDRTIFPPLVRSGEPIGHLTKEIAEELKLNKETLVAVAGHDHMVGSLSVGLNPNNELLNSTGTTEGLLIIQKKPNLSAESLNCKLSNGVYVRPGYYSYFGSLPSVGYSINWARKLFGFNASLLNEGLLSILNVYQSGGFYKKEILFIPHIRGSGPPIRSTQSKGLIYGFDDKTTREDIIFGLFLGLCFELKNLFLIFKKLSHLEKPIVKVIGPAALNPLWLQLKADVLGCDVYAYEIEEAVAKGAAISFAYSQNLIKQTNDFVNEKVTIYHPNKLKTEQFDGLFRSKYLHLLKAKNQIEN